MIAAHASAVIVNVNSRWVLPSGSLVGRPRAHEVAVDLLCESSELGGGRELVAGEQELLARRVQPQALHLLRTVPRSELIEQLSPAEHDQREECSAVDSVLPQHVGGAQDALARFAGQPDDEGQDRLHAMASYRQRRFDDVTHRKPLVDHSLEDVFIERLGADGHVCETALRKPRDRRLIEVIRASLYLVGAVSYTHLTLPTIYS